MISSAISQDRVSRVVGYKVMKGNFGANTPNLPQRIAVLGEANTANQGTIDITPFEFLTSKQVGDRYGYGSPLYQIARILRPLAGNQLGGIPTVIYPQLSDGAATATVIKKGVAVATSVTANAVHKIVINGRDGIDGISLAYSLVIGDLAADVKGKIIAAITACLASPVSAALVVADIDFTTKWEGISSKEINISFDDGGVAAGVVYSEVSKTDGAGVVSLAATLALFQENWNTIVINPYGEEQFDELETFNGVPDPDNPTGRYLATSFKPFVALAGSVLDTIAAIEDITDIAARKSQVTNVICPAPNSLGFTWEAAANMALMIAPIMQNSPHLGNGGRSYYDMPIPADGDIGDFGTYDGRDSLVKKGCSTVLIENAKYTVQDFVTTYHPDGETPPKFRKVRDLNIDWNMAFGWILIMRRDIQDKAIVENDSAVRVADTISPKQAKQLAISFIEDRAGLALLTDVDFSINSLQAGANENNPARLDVYFKYKRTSTADIVSSDVEVDFAFPI
jgi:phage tail sheath gpL-like